MTGQRKRYTAEFKEKVALEAPRGECRGRAADRARHHCGAPKCISRAHLSCPQSGPPAAGLILSLAPPAMDAAPRWRRGSRNMPRGTIPSAPDPGFTHELGWR